jgi:hypothetical protein
MRKKIPVRLRGARIRMPKPIRAFFPGANVAIDDIDLPELEDWMVGCGK